MKRERKDFTGRQYGKLTVLEPAGRRNGQMYWKCRCACGKETTVRQSYLESGKTKSCGCLRAQTGAKNLKFVDGTSVTILEATNKRLIKSNTSGYNGVYLNRKNRKWIAQITFKGKTRYLGAYGKIEDAVRARKEAESKLYGEFLDRYYEERKA